MLALITVAIPSNAPSVPAGGTHSDADQPAGASLVTTGVAAGGHLTNGCHYGPRGVPECGTYFGAAHGANTDPSSWEQRMGNHLGVRRTYWGPDDIQNAVRTARKDLASHRLPWLSFKLPHSWQQMAAGEGDGWVRKVASKLSKLEGPVWVAFHHEPEGDGPIKEWTQMQAHLAPLVRSIAPNVGYSIILTGWNQLYGPDEYHLDSLWPKGTKIDVAGFDIYNWYGTVKDGERTTDRVDLRKKYFEPLSKWASAHDVAWGLGETGYSDFAAGKHPQWLAQTYQEVADTGGVAFSYFDTNLNSIASWNLKDAPAKERVFANVLQESPTLTGTG